MKNFLLASALCLGITGTVTVQAQISGGTYNPNPASTAAFPLFVSNVSDDSITSIGANAAVNSSFVTTGTPGPTGLATNGSGNIYAAVGSGNTFGITRFDATTGAVTAFPANLPFAPEGLTFGPDGFLYAVTNNSAVARINPANGAFTNYVAQTTGGGAGALFAADGITAGPDGNFYVSNSTLNTIVRVTPSASGLSSAGGGATALTLANLSAPIGVIFDHNTLLVANNGNATVTGYLLTAGNFALTSAAGNALLGPTILSGPEGLTVGPDGSVYVANDFGNISGQSNIALITATRDPVTGEILALNAPTIFATESSSLGANFVVFVPEPSTYALFGAAGAAMVVVAVRRRRMVMLRA